MNARPMHAGGETHLRSRSGDSLRGGRARQTLRVVIVDDHPAILEALADTLTGKMDIELVGQARTADEALRVVADEEPAVAVVDVSLKDTYGLDLVQTLRQEFPDLKVIVFSMHDETVFAERAVRAGAAGYVMKTEPTQRVVEAIRSAARGEVYLSRRMASRLLTKLVRGRKHVPRFAVDELTEREAAVFKMLGEGSSVKEIAADLDLNRKTVETYRRRAKEKLGLDSVSELLQFAIQWMHERTP